MWEWTALGASLAGLALYEAWLRRVAARTPLQTARGAHAAIRTSWVKAVLNRPGTEILIIQTLRNSVMAASLMGTTSMLALSATLTLSGAGLPGRGRWSLIAGDGGQCDISCAVLFLLAACFLMSFLLLAMAVRFFNHTGYLISGAVAGDPQLRSEALAIAYLNRASHFYSLGLRAFFACIPFLAGLFSTVLIVPATAVLVVMLYFFDRVPVDESVGAPPGPAPGERVV